MKRKENRRPRDSHVAVVRLAYRRRHDFPTDMTQGPLPVLVVPSGNVSSDSTGQTRRGLGAATSEKEQERAGNVPVPTRTSQRRRRLLQGLVVLQPDRLRYRPVMSEERRHKNKRQENL